MTIEELIDSTKKNLELARLPDYEIAGILQHIKLAYSIGYEDAEKAKIKP